MSRHQAYLWLIQHEGRRRLLLELRQPMTATQLCRRAGLTLDTCLYQLWALRLNGIVVCVNPDTRSNRLYWLTRVGESFQERLRASLALPPLSHHLPELNWDLYASVCFSHRCAVIKAMREPLQAAAIKRRALLQNPRLRMSANNVRDVMGYLVGKDIAKKYRLKKRSHPVYELTDLGAAFRQLLSQAGPSTS